MYIYVHISPLYVHNVHTYVHICTYTIYAYVHICTYTLTLTLEFEESRCEKSHHFCRIFSKVSVLVQLLCKSTTENSFENVCLPPLPPPSVAHQPAERRRIHANRRESREGGGFMPKRGGELVQKGR